MQTIRRYDIDWLRVIAIGLLLIYHIAIAFQPWGLLIGFIQSNEAISAIWTPMAMLNVWRIPLLFFVSGMGVYFAMRKRNWVALIKERSLRILVPFIFGVFAVVPLQVLVIQEYYKQPLSYQYSPSHLWFLGNIFIYVLILAPLFFYLKNHEGSKLANTVKKVFGSPLGIMVMIGLFILEVLLMKPNPFEKYAMTGHGFFYGFLSFLFGFCCVYAGDKFWHMIVKGRFILLILAIGLYVSRIFAFNFTAPWYLLPIESVSWILSAFAFGKLYLNRPSKALSYLSQAAYPVYIIHMFALYGASYLIFPTSITIELQLILVILITTGSCLIIYELLIKRVSFLRPFFGLRPKIKTVANKY